MVNVVCDCHGLVARRPPRFQRHQETYYSLAASNWAASRGGGIKENKGGWRHERSPTIRHRVWDCRPCCCCRYHCRRKVKGGKRCRKASGSLSPRCWRDEHSYETVTHQKPVRMTESTSTLTRAESRAEARERPPQPASPEETHKLPGHGPDCWDRQCSCTFRHG